ncbi:hypothetical protein BVX93_01330 [bacterium B13(2017)]|nr:hypothetical protein BVX93_01330 [bacterium B13(2017)]
MKNKVISEIIQLCLSIENAAYETYNELSDSTKNRTMKKFWKVMSSEEKTHIAFWEKLKYYTSRFTFPPVFESPLKTKNELQQIVPKAKVLIKKSKKLKDIPKTFLIAYRLEFYLLHPSFEMLFHTMCPLIQGKSPEKEYDDHIQKFINCLEKNRQLSLELDLLGETLKNLWDKSKTLTLQATTDFLTTLYNRHGFHCFAEQFCYLAKRNKKYVAVIMIDIDDFKKVNDKYGHPFADIVLKEISLKTKSLIRKSDLIGRYGGEELIVFLPEVKPKGILVLAEKIRKNIEALKPNNITVTVSIGYSYRKIKNNINIELQELINMADNNLLKAKQSGKNQVYSDQLINN